MNSLVFFFSHRVYCTHAVDMTFASAMKNAVLVGMIVGVLHLLMRDGYSAFSSSDAGSATQDVVASRKHQELLAFVMSDNDDARTTETKADPDLARAGESFGATPLVAARSAGPPQPAGAWEGDVAPYDASAGYLFMGS